METIKNYLENMFMYLPRSLEVKRAKEELLTMMEDKYHELKEAGKSENEAIGIVISEFGNLDEISEELGIQEVVSEVRDMEVKWISFEEAKSYLTASVKASVKIAIGVMLCICSPIVVIILNSMAESDYLLSENLADAIGGSLLISMVAVAVGMFIYFGMKLDQYEYLKKEKFRLDNDTTSYIKEQQEKHKSKFTFSIITGVIMCIMSAVPVILIGSIYDGNELIESVSVCIMLIIISMAVYLFITTGMKEESYNVLLQKKEFEPKEKSGNVKKRNTLTDIIASIYWPLVTGIYLFYSFMFSAWGRSWIIWPVAGIIFGGIAAVTSALENYSDERKQDMKRP